MSIAMRRVEPVKAPRLSREDRDEVKLHPQPWARNCFRAVFVLALAAAVLLMRYVLIAHAAAGQVQTALGAGRSRARLRFADDDLALPDGGGASEASSRAAKAIESALSTAEVRVRGTRPHAMANEFRADGPWLTEAIPRVLHQSWSSHKVPAPLARHMRTWRAKLPGWRFELHTDDDNARLVNEQYAWFEPAYARMTTIQQADSARLLFMHASGGVYADLDVELLKPLDAALLDEWRRVRNASAILGQEPLAHALLLERVPRQVCNAVLASARGHPFWLFALKLAAERVESEGGDDPVGTTGPRMLETAVTAWQAVHGATAARVHVAPPDVFYPLWDAGQADGFKERCTSQEEAAHRFQLDAEIRELKLGDAVAATCERLRREGFTPTVPSDGTAFAAHHWAHSWMDGFGEELKAHPETDVLMLDEGGPAAAA